MPFTDDELLEWLPKIRTYANQIRRDGEADELYAMGLLRLLDKRHIVYHRNELYTIIHNESIRDFRKWRARSEPTDPANFSNLADHRADLEAQIYFQEVCRELDKLAPKHKQILGFAANGFSYEEIARRLKIPEGTVRSRLSRARMALHDRLR